MSTENTYPDAGADSETIERTATRLWEVLDEADRAALRDATDSLNKSERKVLKDVIDPLDGNPRISEGDIPRERFVAARDALAQNAHVATVEIRTSATGTPTGLLVTLDEHTECTVPLSDDLRDHDLEITEVKVHDGPLSLYLFPREARP